MAPPRQGIERSLAWIVLVLLLLGCVWVLLPFLSTLLWAAILSISVWPVYARLLKALNGRRTLAAMLISLAMVCLILLPFVVVGLTLADNVEQLTGAVRNWIDSGPPAPPEWLAKTPLVGPQIVERWKALAADSTRLVLAVKPMLQPFSRWVLGASVVVGSGLLQMTLSIIASILILRDGKTIAERAAATVERIAGSRGRRLFEIAGNTIRGVVYGILGTAMIQAVFAAIGFLLAGVPGALLLGLLTFFLSVIPMGTALTWVPAALWLFHQGQTGWGIFMIIWGLFVGTIDNFVRPWLISQGSDMSFLLIFMGVVGGALAFGFIGIFIGPTLLAVGYRLVQEWASTPAPLEDALAAAGASEHSTL